MNSKKSPEWGKVRCELVRLIRGERSQNALNRRLQYKYNQLSRWETGKNRLLWSEFFELCKASKIDLNRAVARSTGYRQDCKDSAALFRHLVADQEILEFSSKLGVTRHKLGRWLQGSIEPQLEDFLNVLFVSPKTLFVFLEDFVNPRLLPELAPLFEIYLSTCQLERRIPAMGAFIRCLDLREYREKEGHVEGIIAKRLGITISQEKEWLKLLEEAGAVVRNSHQQYRPAAGNTDTRGDFALSQRLRLYWIEAARQKLTSLIASPPEGETYGYLVYTASKEDKAEIMKKYFEFYNTVRDIVSKGTQGGEDIQVMNIQIFDLLKLPSESQE